MKATELMIGDLVLVSKDVCFKKGTIVKIHGIDADNVFTEKGLKGVATGMAVNDPDRVTCGVWCDYLEPIPLTEDRLLANGFYCKRNIGYVYDDGEYEVVVDLWNHGYRILHDRDVVMNIHCFSDVFVHELQHALRLCGIDKEITIKED